MTTLAQEAAVHVARTLVHNAPILAFGALMAAAIKVYVDAEKLKRLLVRNAAFAMTGSVAFGALTPLCACGTMAVIVSLLTSALPWGPIMAFLTSSPLMSPDEFILYAGLVGTPFAIALTAASIVIGFGSGFIAHWIEKKTSFLKDQLRFAERPGSRCACDEAEQAAPAQPASLLQRLRLDAFLREVYGLGVKRILMFFTLFVVISFLINRFVPSRYISGLLGAQNAFAVPISAVLGFPMFLGGSTSAPILKTLLEHGASGGAVLAFLITGSGGGIGVLAGLATIIRTRALALYLGLLLFFALVCGYAYNFFLLMRG